MDVVDLWNSPSIFSDDSSFWVCKTGTRNQRGTLLMFYGNAGRYLIKDEEHITDEVWRSSLIQWRVLSLLIAGEDWLSKRKRDRTARAVLGCKESAGICVGPGNSTPVWWRSPSEAFLPVLSAGFLVCAVSMLYCMLQSLSLITQMPDILGKPLRL